MINLLSNILIKKSLITIGTAAALNGALFFGQEMYQCADKIYLHQMEIRMGHESAILDQYETRLSDLMAKAQELQQSTNPDDQRQYRSLMKIALKLDEEYMAHLKQYDQMVRGIRSSYP